MFVDASSLSVRTKSIGVEDRLRQDVRVELREQRRGLVVGDDHRANPARALLVFGAALDHAEHGRLPLGRTALHLLEAKDRRHGRALLTSHKRLVGFYLASEGRRIGFFEREPQSMKHEPGRLLRHAERAAEFVRADAVAVRREEQHGGKPLVEADRRVLKDGSDLDRELPIALAATPSIPVLDSGYVSRAASLMRAGDAVREADTDKEVVRDLLVSEVDDRLAEGSRYARFHAEMISNRCATVGSFAKINLSEVYRLDSCQAGD